MAITSNMNTLYKFMLATVNKFNCGDSPLTYFPSILYLSGVLISSYLVSRLYSRQMATWGIDIFSWKIILQWSVILWIEFIILVKYAVSFIMHQDDSDTGRQRMENVVAFTCASVALLPCALASCLYAQHRSHQEFIDDFVEFVTNLDPRRTEFGYSDRIKEIPLMSYIPSTKHAQIAPFRSCPNLHFKFTTYKSPGEGNLDL